MYWRNPGLPPSEWGRIGIGFSEHYGFETMAARGADPNYINSEIALSLAWIGDYPCFFNMLTAGNDEAFWRFFEYDYVEKQLDSWRTSHPGRRNWHDANIAPHLYLRMLLGESAATVEQELNEQKTMLDPDPRTATENAGFYALFLAGDAPVQLNDWGKSTLLRFDWDKAANRLEAEFESVTESELAFTVKGALQSGPASPVRLLPGRQRIVWQF